MSDEVAAGKDTAVDGSPMGLLSRYGGKRGRQAAVAWAMFQTVRPMVKTIKGHIDERSTYTVKVEGTDDLFPDLHDWMLGLLPEHQRRAMIATTGFRGHGVDVDEGSSAPLPRRMVRLRYDGSRGHTVMLSGHKVKVEVERDETRNFGQIPDNYQAMSQRMVFTTDGPEGRDAVIAHIQALLDARSKRTGPPPLFISNRWGSHWMRRNDLPPRPLDTLILKDGQLERLVDDLGRFLSAEGIYGRQSRPWHRGYLFHGIPGTGKTTAARALANKFDLPVYYLPLAQVESDSDLLNLVGGVDPRSMLVLEDVDVFHSMKQRDDESGGVTLSAILNALDGIWTPHGLITVLTTNDRSVLDDALIRPGRVDVEEEFTAVDVAQVMGLWKWFYDTDRVPNFNSQTLAVGVMSPAEVIGIMSKSERKIDAQHQIGYVTV